MEMPCSRTEEFIALERFQNDEGKDKADQELKSMINGPTVSPANRPEPVERVGHDVVDFRPLVPSDEPDSQTNPEPSRNRFADSRNFVRQLCDVSVLAANVSQLRAVLDNSSGNTYFIPLLVMIAMSIACHIMFGFLMIQRWRKEREAQMEHRKNKAMAKTPQSQASYVDPQENICFCTPCTSVERYDEISMYFMFLVVILNVGIAGLGLSIPEKVSN